MPPAIEQLAQAFVNDPVRVEAARVASTAERIEQGVIHVEQRLKTALLIDLLKDQSIQRALVFARTKHGANRLAEQLYENGILAEAIHGNKSQSQRERALHAFKSGRARLLIATDIAARGIDVDGVTHVFNFDLPDVPESYVHRIGRTARAGAAGSAIAFCAGDERSNLRDIERLIKASIPLIDHPMGQSPNTGGPTSRPARGGGRPQGRGAPRSNAGGFGGDRQRRPERSERSERGSDNRIERPYAPKSERPERPQHERADRAFSARPERSSERPQRAEQSRKEHANGPQRFDYRMDRPEPRGERAARNGSQQERAYGHGGAHGHPSRRPEGRSDAPRTDGRGEGRGDRAPKSFDAPRGAPKGNRGGKPSGGKPGGAAPGGRRNARTTWSSRG